MKNKLRCEVQEISYYTSSPCMVELDKISKVFEQSLFEERKIFDQQIC